jgi:hypothetical protein
MRKLVVNSLEYQGLYFRLTYANTSYTSFMGDTVSVWSDEKSEYVTVTTLPYYVTTVGLDPEAQCTYFAFKNADGKVVVDLLDKTDVVAPNRSDAKSEARFGELY